VPAGPVKPVAAAPAHPPDLTPVPAPPSLIVSGRLTKLSASLAIAHELTKLPMPRSEQLTEIVAGDSVGPLLDVDQPVDFAVASPGEAALARGDLTPLTAVSAAVRDPDAARAALAERYKLVPGENGAWLIQGLG